MCALAERLFNGEAVLVGEVRVTKAAARRVCDALRAFNKDVVMEMAMDEALLGTKHLRASWCAFDFPQWPSVEDIDAILEDTLFLRDGLFVDSILGNGTDTDSDDDDDDDESSDSDSELEVDYPNDQGEDSDGKGGGWSWFPGDDSGFQCNRARDAISAAEDKSERNESGEESSVTNFSDSSSDSGDDRYPLNPPNSPVLSTSRPTSLSKDIDNILEDSWPLRWEPRILYLWSLERIYEAQLILYNSHHSRYLCELTHFRIVNKKPKSGRIISRDMICPLLHSTLRPNEPYVLRWMREFFSVFVSHAVNEADAKICIALAEIEAQNYQLNLRVTRNFMQRHVSLGLVGSSFEDAAEVRNR